MLNHDFFLKSNKYLRLITKGGLLAIAMVILATNYGCSQTAQKDIELEIKSAQPFQGSGLYKVAGTTNLPNNSRLSISAVRYLQPTVQGNVTEVEPRSNRSILARQNVYVKDGKWEADLRLWQVAADGSYQEVWQQNQAKTQFVPENDVMFIATFDQTSQQLKDKPANQNNLDEAKKEQEAIQATTIQQIEGPRLRFTGEGERYVQATTTTAIALPADKTVPPVPRPEDINGGWGDRYRINNQPQTGGAPVAPAQSAQTNRPIQVSELAR